MTVSLARRTRSVRIPSELEFQLHENWEIASQSQWTCPHELSRELFSFRKCWLTFFTAKNSRYDLSENVRGYDFPMVNLLCNVSVTKIRVHSFIDAENLGRTTLHRTDIYRNLSLGAPVQNSECWCPTYSQRFCKTLALLEVHKARRFRALICPLLVSRFVVNVDDTLHLNTSIANRTRNFYTLLVPLLWKQETFIMCARYAVLYRSPLCCVCLFPVSHLFQIPSLL